MKTSFLFTCALLISMTSHAQHSGSFHGGDGWDFTHASVESLSLSPMKKDPKLGNYVELLINNEAYCIMLEQRPLNEYYEAVASAQGKNLAVKILRYRSTGDTCIKFTAMTSAQLEKEKIQAEIDSLQEKINELKKKQND